MDPSCAHTPPMPTELRATVNTLDRYRVLKDLTKSLDIVPRCESQPLLKTLDSMCFEDALTHSDCIHHMLAAIAASQHAILGHHVSLSTAHEIARRAGLHADLSCNWITKLWAATAGAMTCHYLNDFSSAIRTLEPEIERQPRPGCMLILAAAKLAELYLRVDNPPKALRALRIAVKARERASNSSHLGGLIATLIEHHTRKAYNGTSFAPQDRLQSELTWNSITDSISVQTHPVREGRIYARCMHQDFCFLESQVNLQAETA